MRRKMLLVLLGMAVVSGSSGIRAAEIDLKNATAGKWTMDLDAARKIAKEKKLPMLLNFSGSDWCGWCKRMEANVFSQPEWKQYAKDKILMVILDFPKDTSLVPQEYVKRNEELKAGYRVESFPTFIVLDDDAEMELGRLEAGPAKTAASFIAELAGICRYRATNIVQYANTLKPEEKAAYLKIVRQIPECNTAINRHQKQIAAAAQAIEKLQQKVVDVKTSAQTFRATQRGADDLKQYNQLKAELEGATKKLKDWMDTKPEATEENAKQFQAMSAAIQDISVKLSQY